MDAPINSERTMISNSFRREIRRIIIFHILLDLFGLFQPVNAPAPAVCLWQVARRVI